MGDAIIVGGGHNGGILRVKLHRRQTGRCESSTGRFPVGGQYRTNARACSAIRSGVG